MTYDKINKRKNSCESTHTHTSNLKNKIYKIKRKDNIIMPCGYIDTGQNSIVFFVANVIKNK